MKNSNDFKEGAWILAVIAFALALGFLTTGVQLGLMTDIYRGTSGLALSGADGVTVGYLSSGAFFGLSLFMLGLAALSYFTGRGLIKGQKWSKAVTGVMAILIASIGVIAMTQAFVFFGLLLVLIGGTEFWYLFFSKGMKKFFK